MGRVQLSRNGCPLSGKRVLPCTVSSCIAVCLLRRDVWDSFSSMSARWSDRLRYDCHVNDTFNYLIYCSVSRVSLEVGFW